MSPARRYPPLAVIAAAVILAIFTLPSALNLPQANPGQVAEYAPVPGNSNNNQPHGNFAGLGLGQGGSAGTGQPASAPAGQGQVPSGLHCVGNPPRQTEDPLSPPCVPFFLGDNGGATYTGVTAREIRILYYLDGNSTEYTPEGAEANPNDAYVDADAAPQAGDGYWSAALRLLSIYFNTRFQRYNRHVHIWAYFNSGTGNATPEVRRADAAKNWADIHPFAVISYPQYDSQDYLSAMAQHGVVSFVGSKQENSGSTGAPASYFTTYPSLLWSFDPSLDYRAKLFADLVCREVANRPVKFSGNPGDAGKPRKLGLLISELPMEPEQQELDLDVKADLPRCGANVAVYGTKYDTSGAGEQANALQQMAAFKQDQVTTVIDPGQGVWDSRAAAQVQYFPEWVIGGDGLADTSLNGSLNEQTVFRNAWIMSTWTRHGPTAGEDPCGQAAQEANPNVTAYDTLNYFCPLYDSSRQVFTAIQVAGPDLTPAQVDRGFHAIPPIASTNSRVPSCFYPAGDYTCVKDAMLEWWDPSGQDPEYAGPPGCWRPVLDGMRFLDNWPSREISSVQRTGIDACNGQF